MAASKHRLRKRTIAVFDIDGTIIRSSLLIELVDGLIAESIFPSHARHIYDGAHLRWLDRRDSYKRYIGAVVQAFDGYIAGVSEREFKSVVRKIIRVHKDRVYRYTRDLVRDLRRRGYFLLAISHSPKYVVEEFGRVMGFDKTYGRWLELDEHKKKFTGKSMYVDEIMDKAKILKRAVEKEGLTLRGSIGVGDTESDIPFLKLVEQPICFNPNSALYRAAKRRGWKVVIERKDVIYER